MIPVLLLAAASGGGHPSGFDALDTADLERHVMALASAPLEGRDTPSAGLELAARHIESAFSAIGARPLPEREGFRWPFTATVRVPVPEASSLGRVGDASDPPFEYGVDFVPVAGATGRGSGELAFAGFGIEASSERYDDFRRDLRGRVVVVLEGEPRHRRKFDGPEVTPHASLYRKLEALEERGAAAALVVRRPPEDPGVDGRAKEVPAAGELGFRHTWAAWNGESFEGVREVGLPALEISPSAATRLLGRDVLELAAAIDARGKPVRVDLPERVVEVASGSTRSAVRVDNVVGVLPGADPELAGEYVVLGAHYDHVGVDVRGRIGFGADDNASGVAVLLEVASALAEAGPSRSVLLCAFAGEEDGLLGSRAFCGDLPVPSDHVVAMLNLDMVGRGDAKEVAVVGTRENPDLGRVVERAQDLARTGVRELVLGKGRELFERSDHFSFHEVGIPAIFFFEGLPITRNADYHTWRDTPAQLDLEKMVRTARLVYNTAWLLSEDEERPSRPR